MTKHFLLAAAAMGVVGSATPALAAHQIIYAPRTEVSAASLAHQGPNVQGSAYHIINGAVVPQNTQNGPGGSVSGGGSVTASAVQVSQPGGSGNLIFGNSANASANLATGLLKATTESYGSEFFGSPLGFAQARLDDTIFFTNTSGATQTISFTYQFDGQLTNPFNSFPGGNVSLILSCGGNLGGCYNGPNGTGETIMFAKADGSLALLPNNSPVVPFDTNWNYYFSTASSCFGENIYCGQYSSNLWDYGLNAPNAGGVVDGYITAYLNIPTGQTSLGVRGLLSLDCRSGSSCDFGNTGKFAFGALPAGLSFGSASGVFLTQVGQTPGGVPEPESWAMMIVGFGLIGAGMRRRAATRTVAMA